MIIPEEVRTASALQYHIGIVELMVMIKGGCTLRMNKHVANIVAWRNGLDGAADEESQPGAMAVTNCTESFTTRDGQVCFSYCGPNREINAI
jgi:hypothetical protein